ncbi:4Fe-4S protein [Desulfitobacterium dichloroeliminans LMG P-21439]|uniref:4Fe-4S protein n=1 Tax=Desulfitobacterium dichloroeliminans (strain LMG P-21439 / DCA1) TaxID=871963 RepID=L0F8L0_DESDL|nr:ferredoxin family protein [Desulfitobacterium dichloroeliminans]AGA68991.1 4Fe-4S protein [Desulfitobacterium dichloroeliminans LMG P-21439]
MPPVIDQNKCNKCGICAQICPLDVIRVEMKNQEKEMVVKYPDECWYCRACVIDCPKEAIKIRYPLSHMMLHMEVPNA